MCLDSITWMFVFVADSNAVALFVYHFRKTKNGTLILFVVLQFSPQFIVKYPSDKHILYQSIPWVFHSTVFTFYLHTFKLSNTFISFLFTILDKSHTISPIIFTESVRPYQAIKLMNLFLYTLSPSFKKSQIM